MSRSSQERPRGRTGRSGGSRGGRTARRRAESRRAWFLVGGVLLVLLGIVIGRWSGGPAPETEDDAAAASAADEERMAVSPGPAEAPLPPTDRAAPIEPGTVLVALVIDDLGRSVETIGRLAALGIDLSYAVLPFESRTREVVAELDGLDAEILLHLPMEASSSADPGPGSLLLSMDADELRRRTRAAVEAVPGAVGANNHMGSALSSDGSALEPVLRELDELGLFFLDSRTTADSVGFHLARELGIPAAERRVFLDREIDRDEIRIQFRRLLEQAVERGSAIAIGHPYEETIEVLEEEVPAATKAGFRFVPVSYLVERSGVDGM